MKDKTNLKPIEWTILTIICLLFSMSLCYLLHWSCVNGNGREWRQRFGYAETNFIGVEYPNK